METVQARGLKLSRLAIHWSNESDVILRKDFCETQGSGSTGDWRNICIFRRLRTPGKNNGGPSARPGFQGDWRNTGI